jgi:aconitate hydratase
MGQAPASGATTLRSFNRNFMGRSGTADARIYLASAQVCAAAALNGVITDPRDLGDAPVVAMPSRFMVNDNMIVPPTKDPEQVTVVRGPNVKPLPTRGPLQDRLEGQILLITGDNVTTDHIMPAGADILPLRSNIPAMSEYAFTRLDPTFPARAREAGGGFVVGGENYGQGSSREHAALVPMYLGLVSVLAKSYARIHHANLVNVGILPLVFTTPSDYDRLAQRDVLRMVNVRETLQQGRPLTVVNVTQGYETQADHAVSQRQVRILLAGGLLNSIKANRGEDAT